MREGFLGIRLGLIFGHLLKTKPMIRKGRSTHFYFNHIILNLKKQKNKRISLMTEIVNSGVYFYGKQTKKLEKNIKKFLGGNGFLTTVASGHDALILAIKALKLNSSDEVIFPVNSFPTAFAIAESGVKLVPSDVDLNGQLILGEIKKKVSNKTKAIVLVHLYGATGNIEEILEFCKKKSIYLIEDCAQSFGTQFDGKVTGTFADISCFSFYPTKNFATLGDGGAIWTKNKDWYKYLLKAKMYGASENNRYFSEFISGHSRIPEIQAGILNLYFGRLNEDFQARRKRHKQYKETISNLNMSNKIRLLDSDKNSDPIIHLLTAEAENREKLISYLRKKGIATQVRYPHPIHLIPAFAHLGYKKGDFPMAEKLAERIVSLPFHPFLKEKDIDYIVNSIKEFYH